MVSFQASIFRCKLAVNLSFEATDPSLARFGITSIPVQQIYREKIKHNHPKNQPGLLETGDTTQNPSKYRSKLLFFTSSFLEGQMILRAKLNQSSLLQLVNPPCIQHPPTTWWFQPISKIWSWNCIISPGFRVKIPKKIELPLPRQSQLRRERTCSHSEKQVKKLKLSTMSWLIWMDDIIDGSEMPFPTTWGGAKTCRKLWDIYHINWWSPDFWTIILGNIHYTSGRSQVKTTKMVVLTTVKITELTQGIEYTTPYHPCMVYLPTFGWFLW